MGATVSFYPNQPDKGISNSHVRQCQCLFYEIDDLPLASQYIVLEEFKHATGLEPAAVAYTGGKSLHVYFRCTIGLSPENWICLNRKLAISVGQNAGAIAQNADPAICNLARSMRLPGMVRREVIDGELSSARAITLESYSTFRYDPEILEAALDSTGLFPYGLSDQRCVPGSRSTVLKHRRVRTSPAKRDKHLSLKQHRVSGISIPLTVCLTKSDRCTPPLSNMEANTIWQSASKTPAFASRTLDSILTSVSQWHSYKRRSRRTQTGKVSAR
ncbi:hypothetical protein [Phormidesmis priestleyi]